jgi:hypothetical protein
VIWVCWFVKELLGVLTLNIAFFRKNPFFLFLKGNSRFFNLKQFEKENRQIFWDKKRMLFGFFFY